MSKQEADALLKVGISWLNKQHWLVQGSNFYQIKWNNSVGETYFKVDISISIDTDSFITLTYSSEEIEIKDRISLTTTTCNFGGKRYWLLCFSCNKRVGNLYKVGQYFACRYCHCLTYKSRNLKKSLRDNIVFSTLNNMIKIQKLEDNLTRHTYAGLATKKKQRLDWLYTQLPFF